MKFLRSFVVLLNALEFGMCSTCYQCSSAAQIGCDHPFKPSQIGTVDCDLAFGEKTGCLTYILLNTDKDKVPTTTTIRNCAERGSAGNTTCVDILKAVNKEDNDTALLYCSVCYENLCNFETASQVAFSWIVAGVIFIVIVCVCCSCCLNCCRAAAGVI